MANYTELKRRAGFGPFARRLQLDNDFSPCPFHRGDGDQTFHVLAKEDGSVIGTCFSLCGGSEGFKTWDAIAFVKDFDKVSFLEAVRRINAEIGDDIVALRRKETPIPMITEIWNVRGRLVTSEDVATLAASRPHSDTPSAETLNVLGFKTTSTNFFGLCVSSRGQILHRERSPTYNEGFFAGERCFAEGTVQHRRRDRWLRRLHCGERTGCRYSPRTRIHRSFGNVLRAATH